MFSFTRSSLRCVAAMSVLLALMLCRPAGAYSVLSHEEVVDMAWTPQIVPMLKARYPGISDDQIRQAHGYAYGGSVIQDIGYYPFGSKYFSDLLHYARTGEFVAALIRDSRTPDEYAFALGALAHYCGDEVGHPVVNQVTSEENPSLRQRFGSVVTYGEDSTAHVRTEFGFDVAQVAHGHYSQQNYRDFIGFQVAKSLLDQAFEETYGLKVDQVIAHEDLAIKTYRRAVSSLIPEMTKIAYYSDRKEIEQAAPGVTRDKFLYRLNRTEYEREFGTDYTHVGAGSRLFAFVLRLLPKVGPLKALKVTIPSPQEQDQYLKSINGTVDRFRLYLAEIHAAPAPLPPVDEKDAEQARAVADKLSKDATRAQQRADKAADPQDQANRQQVADNVQKASDKAAAAADRTVAKAQAVQAAAAVGAAAPLAPGALPPGSPIAPPTVPRLASVDLDTGKPAVAGEYELADQTWAHLLHDLVKPLTANAASRTQDRAAPDSGLVAEVQVFFAHPVPHAGPPPNAKQADRQLALERQVQSDLGTLRMLTTPVPVPGQAQ